MESLMELNLFKTMLLVLSAVITTDSVIACFRSYRWLKRLRLRWYLRSGYYPRSKFEFTMDAVKASDNSNRRRCFIASLTLVAQIPFYQSNVDVAQTIQFTLMMVGLVLMAANYRYYTETVERIMTRHRATVDDLVH